MEVVAPLPALLQGPYPRMPGPACRYCMLPSQSVIYVAKQERSSLARVWLLEWDHCQAMFVTELDALVVALGFSWDSVTYVSLLAVDPLQ
jgi:hypothetical protein